MSNLQIVEHPLIQQHLTTLRDRHTQPDGFRGLVRKLAFLLAYEATQDLPLTEQVVETPMAPYAGKRLAAKLGVFPILRAGLGMVDPVLELIPTAEVWHLGFYRDEATARPVEYYQKLPAADPPPTALVLDPMLATGGSADLAVSALKEWGVGQIKLLTIIAAREGVEFLQSRHAELEIFVCACDPELDDNKFIVPGLGDAGDRTFNTLR